MYFSQLSLGNQVLILIIFILILLLTMVLYTVKTSVSRTKPLSTGYITISKTSKYKRVKLIYKKIVQKLNQIVTLIVKKIKIFKISIKAHNKQNDIQKK